MVRRLAVALGVLLAAAAAPATAQQVAVATVSADAEAGTNQPVGFSVRKEKPQVQDAIADFEKYRATGAWEKAFGALDRALDGGPAGLTPSDDGFFIPTFARVRSELLSLPAAGREAYRLFYDAKAQRLYQEAVQSDDTIPNLGRIVDRYFLTSIGDRAADRLGDALWETGDFRAAERCWRMIVENYPGTSLPHATLQVKRALAFFRAGQAAEFEDLRKFVRERFAGQTVRLGGRDEPAAQALDRLSPEIATIASTAPVAQPAASTIAAVGATVGATVGPTTMPADDKAMWQVPLFSADDKKRVSEGLSQFGWQMMADQLTSIVPPAATDGHRIYVNWFGSCFAADLQSGKVLWRTAPVPNLGQRLPQAVTQGETFDSMAAVVAAGDRVLYTGRPLGRQPVPQGTTTPLVCLDAESGKVVWNSEKLPALSKWSFIGQPLVQDDAVFACAHPGTVQDLSLLQVDIATGALRSETLLGTMAAGADFRGTGVIPVPVLLAQGRILYVLTNNGALLAVNPSARRVDWAFTFPTKVEAQQRIFFSNSASPGPTPAGAMLAAGDTLFFKETGGEMLYALDLSGPSLKWKRPAEPTVTLAGADANGLYLVGNEVDCIDADSHALRWSDRLSTSATNVRPLFAGGHLYVFGARGIHDIATAGGDAGPIFRGADRDGSGGALWQTGDTLITVSNSAVTAYPLKSGGPAAATQQAGESHPSQPEASQ